MRTPLSFGLFADPPDLVETVPSFARLKVRYPDYIRQAEAAQATARRFARQEMLPRVLETDLKCTDDPTWFDWELWRRANDLKLTIAPIPEKLGGLGFSALSSALLVEELASVCLASASNITFNTFGLLGALVECRTGIVMRIISEMVDAQQKSRPLFWSWAITEPGAGTDMEEGSAMARMRPSTHAKKVPGGYKINGTKCFITNGSLAHYVIANIPTDTDAPKDSMATFLISTDTEGFCVGRVERKCGQKASQTAELFFKDVFVSEENMWEPPGRGLRHTREILSITRGFIGTAGLGLARGALTAAMRYAAEKKINGHRLIDEDWVRFILAGAMEEIAAVRNTCYNFAVALDACHVWQLFDYRPVKTALRIIPKTALNSRSVQHLAGSAIVERAGCRIKQGFVSDDAVEDFVALGSAAKVAGTDLAVRVSSRMLDIVGIEGMAHEHGIEKYFRDAKITQIYEGSNQANRIDLINHAVGAAEAGRG